MDKNTSSPSVDVDASYKKVVEVIHATIDKPLSDEEANEAARNLTGLFRTLLSIHLRLEEQAHEEHNQPSPR